MGPVQQYVDDMASKTVQTTNTSNSFTSDNDTSQEISIIDEESGDADVILEDSAEAFASKKDDISISILDHNISSSMHMHLK
jgi:hypothetical protein